MLFFFPFHVNSIASGFKHVEIGAVEKTVTVVHYKPSAQEKDQFQEIFMEYERKNLCCDDGFLIIFCHDRYYKVHFCGLLLLSNNYKNSSYCLFFNSLVRRTIQDYLFVFISSKCCSGTPNEVRPHHHTAIMIHKITHKKLLRTSPGS